MTDKYDSNIVLPFFGSRVNSAGRCIQYCTRLLPYFVHLHPGLWRLNTVSICRVFFMRPLSRMIFFKSPRSATITVEKVHQHFLLRRLLGWEGVATHSGKCFFLSWPKPLGSIDIWYI